MVYIVVEIGLTVAEVPVSVVLPVLYVYVAAPLGVETKLAPGHTEPLLALNTGILLIEPDTETL
jgi:hypothetical protein